MFNLYMFHTTLYYYYYLHLHLHWGDTDISFVAICKSSLNKYVYNNVENAMYLDDIDINEAWNRFIFICVVWICRWELYNTLCSQGKYITYINYNLRLLCAITITKYIFLNFTIYEYVHLANCRDFIQQVRLI